MFQVTINVTTREIVETGNPAMPMDVRKVQVVESKGEAKSPEKAFQEAYEKSGLKEFVELLSGQPRIVTPGNFGVGS